MVYNIYTYRRKNNSTNQIDKTKWLNPIQYIVTQLPEVTPCTTDLLVFEDMVIPQHGHRLGTLSHIKHFVLK